MRLREHDIVRVIDLLLVRKNADGTVETSRDRRQLTSYGDGRLRRRAHRLGRRRRRGRRGWRHRRGGGRSRTGSAFDDQDVWSIAEAIPEGMTAAVAVLEHRWAIPLREAITDAGGVALADRWIHPAGPARHRRGDGLTSRPDERSIGRRPGLLSAAAARTRAGRRAGSRAGSSAGADGSKTAISPTDSSANGDPS